MVYSVSCNFKQGFTPRTKNNRPFDDQARRREWKQKYMPEARTPTPTKPPLEFTLLQVVQVTKIKTCSIVKDSWNKFKKWKIDMKEKLNNWFVKLKTLKVIKSQHSISFYMQKNIKAEGNIHLPRG